MAAVTRRPERGDLDGRVSAAGGVGDAFFLAWRSNGSDGTALSQAAKALSLLGIGRNGLTRRSDVARAPASGGVGDARFLAWCSNGNGGTASAQDATALPLLGISGGGDRCRRSGLTRLSVGTAAGSADSPPCPAALRTTPEGMGDGRLCSGLRRPGDGDAAARRGASRQARPPPTRSTPVWYTLAGERARRRNGLRRRSAGKPAAGLGAAPRPAALAPALLTTGGLVAG
mmetsp:Transcript_27033/g.50813  ORF Transcript_27033/g.50813 Transcript_27033/m.50813 type:complete len:230 (-) Transcript_27033:336-1025(-)